MSEFVKKMLFNTYVEVAYEDEATHILFSIDEYYDQQQQNRSDLASAKEKYKQKLQVYYEKRMKDQEYDLIETKAINNMLQTKCDDLKEENHFVKEEIASLDTKLESLETEKEKYREEAERNIFLNNNLIRILKERANAQNGQPKTASGYTVIYSGQYNDPDFYVPIWRTCIRTPYDAGIPIDDLRREIRRALMYDVLGLMGIEVLQKFDRNGIFDNWKDENDTVMNAAFKMMYKANYRDGCWEIELYHNKPVFVPQALRPVSKASKTTKGGKTTHGKRGRNIH